MSKVGALLAKAERSFGAAELLLEAGSPDFSASRAYYGCFCVAEALLLSEGLRFSKHGQVISQYGRLFAAQETLDRRFHRLLNRTFSMRRSADHTTDIDMDVEETRKVIEEGREFLGAAQEDYLDRREAEGESS